MRLAVVLILCILAVVMLSMQFAAAQQNDYMVVPGQRVGLWELGKPVDAYNFGSHSSKWEGTASGRPYYDGYTFPQQPRGPYLYAYACKSDSLLFALMVARRLNLQLSSDAEEFKYRTAEDVRIGTDESDVVKVLGSPDATSQFTERHGQFELLVRQLEYRSKGLVVRVNRTESKVFALGASRGGGFPACQQAVVGASAAQPTVVRSQAGILVTVSLPVPLPRDLRIIPPSAEIPTDRAAFSGVWSGKWESYVASDGRTFRYGNFHTALVVQEITPKAVSVIYAWGEAPEFRITRPGWSRKPGVFAEGELHLKNGSIVVYRMRPDGRLDAEFRGAEYGSSLTRGTLSKVFPY